VARILDANAHFAGQEPKFGIEVTKIQLITALNWYNQNKAAKDAEKYATDFFKKKYKLDISDVAKNYTNTFGWVCRIVSNGGTLNTKDQIWFENKIEEIKTLIEQKQTVVVSKTNVISIQDRIADKVSELAGEIEGSIDDYILSDFATMPSPYAIMQNKAKGIHASKLIDIFKKHRAEFDEASTTKDEQLKEGYSNFSKSELKKLIAYCDLIITDAMKISGESIQTRKPRKRKAKSPEQLVAKIKYMEKFDELKLTSVAPKDIIGAMSLWVYNVKTRKMGCYHAADAGGLSMKGSTLLNFNETKSVQKKLRKPEQMLPDVLNGGKVFLRNVIENIRAVESQMTGRLNADTILLKVTK
jgi:hypothetical protein